MDVQAFFDEHEKSSMPAGLAFLINSQIELHMRAPQGHSPALRVAELNIDDNQVCVIGPKEKMRLGFTYEYELPGWKASSIGAYRDWYIFRFEDNDKLYYICPTAQVMDDLLNSEDRNFSANTRIGRFMDRHLPGVYNFFRKREANSSPHKIREVLYDEYERDRGQFSSEHLQV